MEGFEEFWKVYPRRVAKGAARKAWAAAEKREADLLEKCLRALAWQTRQPQWTKDDGQYVPYAATWLRGERWTDECPPMLRAAVELAETPEQVAARRARVEAESAARFQRERTLAFPERRGA